MAQIGKMNTLKVDRLVPFGCYLDAEQLGEVLLPSAVMPENCQPDDEVSVFIYTDSEDELIATTLKPKVMLGEFAYLNVVSVSHAGAFLDWGLSKDLMAPYSEQWDKMQEGNSYIIYAYREQGHIRIAASSRIESYLNGTPAVYEVNQSVSLLIYDETDLGFKAIINNAHSGLLFHSEIFQTVEIGQTLTGYIKLVREDGKVDLCLQKAGYSKNISLADKIMLTLAEKGGFLPLGDKSAPELIYEEFGVSKKKYKMALGDLYKQKKIVFVKNGIATKV